MTTTNATYISLMLAAEQATTLKEAQEILAKVRELAAADAATYVK